METDTNTIREKKYFFFKDFYVHDQGLNKEMGLCQTFEKYFQNVTLICVIVSATDVTQKF